MSGVDAGQKVLDEKESVPNWREEVKGQYVSFLDQPTHVITFLEENPKRDFQEYDGEPKTAYQWRVQEGDFERTLSVTSGRLLGKLRKIEPLKNKTLKITYHRDEYVYTIEEV